MQALATVVAALLALSGSVAAIPAPVPAVTAAASPVGAATAAVTGNPYSGVQLYANPFYSSEVVSIAIPSMVAEGSTALAAKATAVAQVPSYYWL